MTDVVVHVPEDRTDALARTLGLPVRDFADLLGAPWHEAPGAPAHDFDLDPDGGLGLPATPWHVSGEPVQLMVRVFDHGIFLARPIGRWSHGTHGLVHDPVDQEYVGRHEFERAREVAGAWSRGDVAASGGAATAGAPCHPRSGSTICVRAAPRPGSASSTDALRGGSHAPGAGDPPRKARCPVL